MQVGIVLLNRKATESRVTVEKDLKNPIPWEEAHVS